jgi:hypothetical protein
MKLVKCLFDPKRQWFAMFPFVVQLKRQCFAAWYSIVIERRLQLGKAKATADWKVLFRAFSAWKSSYISGKVERETHRHETVIKQMQRFNSLFGVFLFLRMHVLLGIDEERHKIPGVCRSSVQCVSE